VGLVPKIMVTVGVGVVVNPASGRDLRRLVTGASVFDNAEKAAMVHRLMAGLGAARGDRVVMMPAGSGLSQSLQRHLSGRTGHSPHMEAANEVNRLVGAFLDEQDPP
jgi:predicted polyphosphate/ATP-dependent NAD kinase